MSQKARCLINTSAIARITCGYIVVLPLIFMSVITGKVGIATITDRDRYFEYAANTCRDDDGLVQTEAIKFKRMIKVDDGRMVRGQRSTNRLAV